MTDTWLGLNPGNITGAGGSQPDSGSGGLMSGLQTAAMTNNGGSNPPPWSPDSSLFWFGAILAVTAVLIGASVSVKAGPISASAKA